MQKANEDVYQFIQNNVNGRVLKTDGTIYQLEDGKLEGCYEDEMFFSDLLHSQNGFKFNMTTITREKIYHYDQATKTRGSLKKDFTGVSVFHYELAQRKSSSQLTGVMKLISSTVPDHTMEGVAYGAYNFKIDENQLYWNEQQLLYRDMPTDTNEFRSVAFDADIRFYLEDNKLRFEYKPRYYEVNPHTLEKKPSKDTYPIFLTKET